MGASATGAPYLFSKCLIKPPFTSQCSLLMCPLLSKQYTSPKTGFCMLFALKRNAATIRYIRVFFDHLNGVLKMVKRGNYARRPFKCKNIKEKGLEGV